MLHRARVIAAEALHGSSVEPVVTRQRRPVSEVVRREVLEAQKQAEAILAAATLRAEQLEENAQRSAERVRADAEQVGYEVGLAKVIAESVSSSQREATRARRRLESDVAVATLLAERLVGRAIAIEPGVIAEMAETALREVRGLRGVRITVHPSDVQALRSALHSATLGQQVLEVLADSKLDRGDLIFETESGKLEAKLGSRLDKLARSLLESSTREGST